MAYEGSITLGNMFTSSKEKGKSGLPTLSVTLNNGLVYRDELDRKTDTNLSPEQHLLVKKGYIAYNMMRMWQGASGLANNEGIVSPAYVVLAPTKYTNSLYAAYLFKSPRMIYLFWAYSYGLTKDRLRLYYNDFKRIPVSVPSVKEQQKIAKILSTWDKAIETVEQLIENSQLQKKALMQQLLTGKKRLPGFGGKWKKLKLKSVVEVVYGKSPKEIISDEGKYFVVGTGGFSGKTDAIMCKGPSVVIGRKGTIHKPIYLDEPFWAIDTTFYCTPKKDCCIKWFYYAISSINLKKYNEASGVPSLSRETLYSIKLLVPDVDEQERIAEVLSCAENEIHILNSQVECLKQEKKSLMQQLLTGKRRIVVKESVAEAESA